MTVKEIVEKMDSFTDEERTEYLAPLLDNLTLLSKSQIRNFQDVWDGNRPFDEFKTAQNTEIRKCIEMELSALGQIVRRTTGLPPLNENDEVKSEEA